MEGCGLDLSVPPSGCSDGRGRTGGGGYLCHPASKHGRIVHQNPSIYGHISLNEAAPWVKGAQEVVGTRWFGLGGGTGGGREGRGGGKGGVRIRYWERDKTLLVAI